MNDKYVRTAQEQAAQDARDRLAEQSGLLLIEIAEKLKLGQSERIDRIGNAVDDLRHHTGRGKHGWRD